MEIGEKIRLFRQLKGWSQEEMAEKMGMSVNGYANIERGETDIQLSRLEQLAGLFGIPVHNFIGFNERNIFNLADTQNDQSHWNIQSPVDQQLQHEIEKLRILVGQQQKEIALLREIISLLKSCPTQEPRPLRLASDG